MFSAATPVLLIQGEGKVRLVEMVDINKSSYPRYSESLQMAMPFAMLVYSWYLLSCYPHNINKRKEWVDLSDYRMLFGAVNTI